jgi:hypothetical protein
MWIAGITRRPALTPNARRIQPKPALKFPARAGDTIERGTPGFTAGGFFICTGDSLSECLKPRTAAPQASKPQRRPPPPSMPSPRTSLSARSAKLRTRERRRRQPKATNGRRASRRGPRRKPQRRQSCSWPDKMPTRRKKGASLREIWCCNWLAVQVCATHP